MQCSCCTRKTLVNAFVASFFPCVQCAESEKKTAGGVLLANDSGDKPNFGTVIAVGEGKKTDDGAQVKPNVDIGATVMYSKYSGTEYEVSSSTAAGVVSGT